MAYRLALDVGTSSIGLMAVRLVDRQPAEVVYHACRIFAEPLDPGKKKDSTGEPKKARRRRARLARRLIDRRSRRLKRIASLATLISLNPATIEADDGQLLHRLRAEAAMRPIQLPDLLRVLLRMAKRRGYSGGFKTKREDQEEGQVEGGISKLREEMAKAKCEYLGQYLYHRFQNGETLKLKEAGLYADREMVESEFAQIWNVQSQAHPALNGSYKGEALRKIFRGAIFYQRPLKSVAGMVGNCALEPSLPRAPMSQPAAQAFRIEKQLSDLRWGSGRRAQTLTADQRDVIRGLLNEKDKVSFVAIKKALDKVGCNNQGRSLNADRFSRPELRGNSTNAAFEKLGLLMAWKALSSNVQVSVTNFLADLGSPQEVDRPDWHKQYRRSDGSLREFKLDMIAFIDKLVDSGRFDRLSKMGFDGGRAAYSVKALNKLIEWLRNPWWPEGWKGDMTLSEENAIRVCYPDSTLKDKSLQRKLEPHVATGNVVVDVALRQLWYQVNACIEKLGEPPAEVIVELTRDMGLGVKRRNDIEDRINKNRKDRQHAADELSKHGESVTDRNIFRYLLWQQQETACPYCETKIGLHEAVSGSATNIEHIVPRSLTRVGRQRDHLVLAHRACNDEKGNRTPWQAWGSNVERWATIEAHAKALEKKKKFYTKARLLTIKDYEGEVLDDAAIQGFSERQFHETSWIAKLTAQWLRTVCPNVAVSRGELTGFLRRIWKLETVIPEVRYEDNLPVLDTDRQPITREEFDRFRRCWEGHDRDPGVEQTDRKIDKRIDHRHHVIDALVIAMTSRGLYQKMARHWKVEREAGRKPNLSVPPPMRDLRDRALELVRNCNLTHKPDRHLGGSLFQDYAYGVMSVESDKDPNADPIRYLTRRVKLIDLAMKNNKELTLPSVRKNLEEIAHVTTRREVQRVFEKRIAQGKSPREALIEPILHPDLHTPIKKLKLLHGKADAAERIEHSGKRDDRDAPYFKYLVNNGYAYLDLLTAPNGKPEARLVPLRIAYANKNRPVVADVMRFFKGDMVQDTRDGKRLIVKQIKSEMGGRLFLIPITEAREVEEIQAIRKLFRSNGWTQPDDFRTVSPISIAKLIHVDS